ncbi:MAG: exodeoxyribonuclease VII large subunit [Bacteroidota bacterium]|nr:exodeoxyribonuclease VII large subunit [Bacteroidota bacterium]
MPDSNAISVSTRQNSVSVSAYVRTLKRTVESVAPCWVTGEIQQFKASARGHWYFTVRDRDASLDCAMWSRQARRVLFRPEAGMLVDIYGSPSVYPKQGRLQFYAEKLTRQDSEGALLLAFRRLKAKLEKEGLFEGSRKRPIPQFPHTIGVVTSATGAAFQDIVHITGQRYPLCRILLSPSLVQGDEAAVQIAGAIERLGTLRPPDRPDVLIVGRGGGSVQDLQPFNEEAVARAIFACPIPVISAVGHETDVTIADLVADLRAATPSHAAELAVPDQQVLYSTVQVVSDHMHSRVLQQVAARRAGIEHITNSYEFNTPVNRVREAQQWLEELTEQLHTSLSGRLLSLRHAAEKQLANLTALDPRRGLRQGLVRVERMGKPVRSSSSLQWGDRIQLHFLDGQRVAVIDS